VIAPTARFAAMAAAESRKFPCTCPNLYPVAVHSMIDAKYAVAVSDATGGVLTMSYQGAPFRHKVKNLLLKYVLRADFDAYSSLSFGQASLLFQQRSGDCLLNLAVTLNGLLEVRNWVTLPSNGTAECELLSQIAKYLKD
jgi:hypothetical protein